MGQRLTEAELQQALDTCASEPVHIPGIVQPFGYLLAYDPDTGLVRYASANCSDLLGKPLNELLGTSAKDHLGPEVWHELRNAASRNEFSDENLSVFNSEVNGMLCAIGAFESGGMHVVEIEKTRADILNGAEALRSMSFLMAQVHACTEKQELMDLTVNLIRHFTGYDRVMIYQFDHEFNGEVISETCRSSMPSFAGLRFPHWDIPEQARAIMKKVPVRLIEDVDQVPVPLVAAGADLPPLDITLAACRGVSPVHMQYLTNLGSKATMTLNIVVEDRLWGIISLHNRSRKVPPATLREVLKSFVPVFSAKLLAIRNEETLGRIRRLEETIVSDPARDFRMEKLLPEIAPLVMEVIDADGIAAIGATTTSSFGMSPKPELLRQLQIHASGQVGAVIAIDNLVDAFPDLAKETNGCAGALVASILPDSAICIFRREVSQDVAWAGKPDKPVTEVDGKLRLSPRGSFSVYIENVAGRSKTWSADDQYFIGHVRTLLHASERQTLMNTMNRQQSLMIDELNHRVRNILALVRSVSRQSRRRYTSIDGYADAIESRIRALAASHELNAQSLTSSVSIKSLIKKEFEPFTKVAESRLHLEGPDRNLLAETAPIFSLVMHELATNTVKYGALSVEEGEVRITLERLPDAMQVTWQEHGGPTVNTSAANGFGRAMIEHAVPHELGGSAQLIFEPAGVKAVFLLPDRHFDDTEAPRDLEPRADPRAPGAKRFSAKDIRGPVLLLEDNYLIAKEMSDQMREFGFAEVEIFANSVDALAFLDIEPVALAILDVNLGQNQDSFEVAMKLQGMGLPFLFVTGYGGNAALPDPLKDTPLLSKPVSTDELQEQLFKLTR
ncbi:HWE histidine kinase domain-containing protein [uncultured Roseobacter sp.]|uniref:HWE histidine kinase domain-containing protein n=1 Tax=uncultured Roseobacter sp. TaxID=114847 RepID=UPI00261E2DA9|nr:HWE histidine kinase domain-containing protein [uncultured Roseobacter sp.]